MCENEFAQQSIEMDEMELQLLEYKLIIEEMTKDYKATIHSMYPWMMEKVRVKNRTNNYGHQEWKPYVDKLIIEMLCHRTPPTCIQSVMVAFSKGKQMSMKDGHVHIITMHIISQSTFN